MTAAAAVDLSGMAEASSSSERAEKRSTDLPTFALPRAAGDVGGGILILPCIGIDIDEGDCA